MARLTPLGVFLKWVAAPLAVAAVGYFLVGPSLGKDAVDKKHLEKVTSLFNRPATTIAETTSQTPPTQPAVFTGGPDVEVSVAPVNQVKPKRTIRIRRNKPEEQKAKPEVKKEEPTITIPEPAEEIPPIEAAPPVDDPGTTGDTGDGATTGASQTTGGDGN